MHPFAGFTGSPFHRSPSPESSGSGRWLPRKGADCTSISAVSCSILSSRKSTFGENLRRPETHDARGKDPATRSVRPGSLRSRPARARGRPALAGSLCPCNRAVNHCPPRDAHHVGHDTRQLDPGVFQHAVQAVHFWRPVLGLPFAIARSGRANRESGRAGPNCRAATRIRATAPAIRCRGSRSFGPGTSPVILWPVSRNSSYCSAKARYGFDDDEADCRRAGGVDHHRLEGAQQPRRHQPGDPRAGHGQGRGARLPAERRGALADAAPHAHARHRHSGSDALVLRRGRRRHRTRGQRARLRPAAVQLGRELREGTIGAAAAARPSGRRHHPRAVAGHRQRGSPERSARARHRHRHDRSRRLSERALPPRADRRRARGHAGDRASAQRGPARDRSSLRTQADTCAAAREGLEGGAARCGDQGARRLAGAGRVHGE